MAVIGKAEVKVTVARPRRIFVGDRVRLTRGFDRRVPNKKPVVWPRGTEGNVVDVVGIDYEGRTSYELSVYHEGEGKHVHIDAWEHDIERVYTKHENAERMANALERIADALERNAPNIFLAVGHKGLTREQTEELVETANAHTDTSDPEWVGPRRGL